MGVDIAAGSDSNGANGGRGGDGDPFEREEDLDAAEATAALSASNGYGGGEAGPRIGDNHQAVIPDLASVAKDGALVVYKRERGYGG